MEQMLLNSVFGLVAFLGGYVLNGLRDTVRDLQKQDLELATKVQSIEVLVAGNYVKKDEFDRLTERLFIKLDVIESKLERKVDR